MTVLSATLWSGLRHSCACSGSGAHVRWAAAGGVHICPQLQHRHPTACAAAHPQLAALLLRKLVILAHCNSEECTSRPVRGAGAVLSRPVGAPGRGPCNRPLTLLLLLVLLRAWLLELQHDCHQRSHRKVGLGVRCCTWLLPFHGEHV